MLKKLIAFALVVVMAFTVFGCSTDNKNDGNDSQLPNYADKSFQLAGYWAPRSITEEAVQLYKDAGFNVFSFTNHDELPRNSETQYYLGSQLTEKMLKICKKVGIDVYINWGGAWYNRENEGDEYFDNNPFTTHDYYSEYKDIIKGVHIWDEPIKDDLDYVGNKDFIADFEKAYPNTKYIVNLIPMTAIETRGFITYDEMMTDYETKVMDKLALPYVSVDVYPFHENNNDDDRTLATNYNYIAKSAKKYGIKPSFILQTAVGGEFETRLSESDLRWEIYTALAFGSDNLEYYCYSVPDGWDYDRCILNQDGTPSDIYYNLQKLHKEIQSFSNAILSYNWDSSYAIDGTDDYTFRLSGILYDENFEEVKLENDEYYVTSTATQDTLLSRFTSEEYGNAYMFVNFAERDNADTVKVTFKNCKKIAVYGGEGFSGTPETVTLDENGNATLQLNYGEGKFIVPLK